MESDCLISAGRGRGRGAQWEKAPQPADRDRSPVFLECNAQDGMKGLMRSDKYEGTSPFTILYVIRRPLKV